MLRWADRFARPAPGDDTAAAAFDDVVDVVVAAAADDAIACKWEARAAAAADCRSTGRAAVEPRQPVAVAAASLSCTAACGGCTPCPHSPDARAARFD